MEGLSVSEIMMNKNDYKVEKTETWKCPAGTGIPLITMPNVPRPLHGLPPRKIMGQANWDRMRKRCYYDAGYKCEICKCEPPKGQLHAHELYSYDWLEGTGKFERCIAICKQDHDFIHSGRLITMLKNGNPLYPKSYVLGVVEKGFKLISEYNATHRNKKPLKAYSTFLEYLKVPEIREDMEKLIKKYGIEFYEEPTHIAKWSDWRLLYGTKEYPTPYKDVAEWQTAMEQNAKQDTMRIAGETNPFKGGVYDRIDEILNEN